MRILQVRFKNLNSLVGEWEIDLAHSTFVSDGIFAITGPTGSGKTTILDAICLALYGRTPRLNKVTRNENEIMSRQTGECFAEVTFETQSGRFRCHWSQHRARKKPEGVLQAPSHEIADADSGEIFKVKLRDVAEYIETTTGMDFDRFTRSMLLAQGGFAVFLKAAPDERAPILEQITGTEIYSMISVRVHELRSEERQKLDILQAELDGMQLLSEEDEQQLKASLDQKVLKDADLNKHVEQRNQAIAWLDKIALFEEELEELGEGKRRLLKRKVAFQPELDKLERGRQALELAGEYNRLFLLRSEQKADRKRNIEYEQKLPEHEAIVKQVEKTLKLTSENLKEKKDKQKKILPVIRKVRELDLKLREKEAPIKTSEDNISAIEISLNALRTRNDEDCRDLDSKKTELKKVLKDLSQSKADEGLIEHLGGIRIQLDALSELDRKNSDKVVEFEAAEIKQAEALQEWDNQSTNLKARIKEFEVIGSDLDQRQIELKKILANREVTDWRKALLELTEEKLLLENVSKSVKSSAELRHDQCELNNKHETLTAEKDSLIHQIKQQTERLTVLEKEMHLLETQLSLHMKIQDLEEARHQLQDGEPCPLCGAKEHPFAEGNTPVLDETTNRLNQVREDSRIAGDALSELKIKQAETLKDLKQIAERQTEIAGTITNEEVLIKEGLVDLSVETSDEELDELLLRLRQENKDNLDSTSKILETIEGYEEEIGTLRESLDKAREEVVKSEMDSQTATHRKDSAEQAAIRMKKELEEFADQLQKTQENTLCDVSPYGIKSLSTDVLDQVQLELASRRDQWGARYKKKNELEKQISDLKLQTQYQSEQMKKSEIDLKEQRNVLNNLMRDKDSLTNDRKELFGDKNPNDEESHLSSAIDDSEKHLEDSQKILNSAVQELNKLKSRVEVIERTMLDRAGQLKTREESFHTRLGASGFTDETSYRAACLPEDERKSLMQRAEKLVNEKTELDAISREKDNLLEIERQKKITDQPRDQLKQELDDLTKSLKALQQEVGGISQKLNDNDSLKHKHQERAKSINAQKRECVRWDILHKLIGSADGKKYRNFAQGLTFDMMIGYANQQLQKMTDRYLLIRDGCQSLELNVVDNYQAGETRSTKNLSGGESFIVSLSLALGLSQMASKNVRVDSLFLDEGFSTLDEEALDTALETLAGLQQDGKLIGVISHVSALKERISTQIQVIPHTGGRSIISGPGCSSLDKKAEA